jgi:hypothetical protein
MAWIKSTSKNADGSTSNINTDSFTTSKFMVNLISDLSAPSGFSRYKFNNDSGAKYAQRASANGGADGASASRVYQDVHASSSSTPTFLISYTANISGEEKLSIGFTIQQNTAGAGNAPDRVELAWKYVPSPDADITISTYDSSAGSNYVVNSNNSVIGSDGTESLNVQDGAIYYDTTLNKEYVLYNNTWTEV